MKLWGGRFQEPTDTLMQRFSASLPFDQRLADVDIRGSIAYAGALEKAGLISAEERAQLVNGLEQVRAEFAAGTFHFESSDEDIHTAVERRLGELIGPLAGKLHTGRSRNDQVATDLRLYLLEETPVLRCAIGELQAALVGQAEAHTETLLPGYTHLQQAQPVLLAHWFLAYFWKFQRDKERLHDCAQRTAVLPLGTGALAGNPFGIDRYALAMALGFPRVAENSIDAVGDRDFVAEFLSWAALLQVHLSGIAEELIIWSTREFGFVRIHDAFATGSSLMPHKRNPDSLELIRGKTGRMIGHLSGFLATLKGLPTAYNRDLQEDKEPIFDALDTVKAELTIMAGVVRTLEVNRERMQAVLDDGMLTTDLADYLVRRGVPFRQSHYLVGQAVKRAEALGVPLRELPLAEYQALHPAFDEDLYTVFDFRQAVERRTSVGGTATVALQAQLAQARMLLESEGAL